MQMSAEPRRRAASSSSKRILPIREAMPTLTAALIASLAGWLVESPTRAVLGPVSSMTLSLVVSTVAFFFAKRFVSNLRG